MKGGAGPNDELAAFHSVIEAWRRDPHPRLGAIAERLGERLAEGRDPLGARSTRADRDRWWAVLAEGDAVDLPRLCAAARGGSQEEVGQRVAALAERRDPRFAAWMVRLLEDPPYAGIKSRGLLAQILDAIADTGDRRVVPALRDLAARYPGIVPTSTGGWVSERLFVVAAAIEARPAPQLDPEADALCRRWGDDVPQDRPALDASALLEQIYADPDDDSPRLVYADLLMERGDPRGQFVALQVRRAAGLDRPGDRSRERSLTLDDARLASWSQPLRNAGTCRFARGFVDHVDLYRALPERLIGDPAWSTVTSVSGIEKVSQKRARALLEAPAARWIRSVSTFTGVSLLRLRDRTWGFRAVEVRVPDPLRSDALDAFPHLESLALHLGAVHPSLLEGLSTVRSLTLSGTALPDGWIRRLGGLRALTLDLDPAQLSPELSALDGLRVLEVKFWRSGLRAEHVPAGLEELSAPYGDLSTALLERVPGLRLLRAKVPMSAVPALPLLREVALAGNAYAAELAALLRRCPNLHTVTLHTVGTETPAVMRAMVEAQREGGLANLVFRGAGCLAVALGPQGLVVEGAASEVAAVVQGWPDIEAVAVSSGTEAEIAAVRASTGAPVELIG